jgi:hypothetical protein
MQRISRTIIFAILLTLTLSSAFAVTAQEPTPTPTDPFWLGFGIARTAITEERGVNLERVLMWEFYQDDWSFVNPKHPQGAAGIDSCNYDISIAEARPLYFGITYRMTDMAGRNYEARVSFDLKQVTVCTELQEPIAGGGGGTVTNPDLPPPVGGSGNISGFALGGHVDGLSQSAVDAMNQSGMTWVKKQVRLDYGVAAGQSMINDAHSRGFKILLGVVGDKAQIGANFDGYAQEYNSFVAQLAASGADAIEVWNEPNIDREWPAGQINGANYTRLLAGAYNAIKGANSNTIVISGAPAPTGFFGAAGCTDQGCNDDVFMQQMAAAGAAQYMDCVGLHYNEGIVPPTQNSGDPRGEYPSYYFGSMLNRGYSPFGGTPVCWTELGYLSGEGMGATIPPSFAWAGNTTVAQHADWLASAASLSAQSGKVSLMIIWNVNFTRWDSDPMGGFAMIRPDGSCPACATLGAVMR